MSLEQQLSDAIAAQNALTQAVAAKKGEIDAATAAQLAAFNAWKSGVLETSKLSFDPTVVRDKTSLLGVGTANVDSADNTVSKWVQIGSDLCYAGERVLVHLDAAICYAAPPGYYEATQYANDKSCSYMQFVLANTGATSDQINARLNALGIGLNDYGAWGNNNTLIKTTCVQISSVHPYTGLWMRFVNRRWTAGAGAGPAQAINIFGGNNYAKLRMATIYNGMNY
jgi:hypothetical protein